MQWISGTQHFTASDLDLLGLLEPFLWESRLIHLVGGPNRPPSKRMIEQQRTDARSAQQTTNQSNTSTAQQQNDGYWAAMQKQITTRTNNINLIGDSMDRLEETSANWVNSASKFVEDQKKKAVLGSKLFLCQ